MSDFGVSWRTILVYMEELKDQWINIEAFSKLHSMSLFAVTRHFNNLKSWGCLRESLIRVEKPENRTRKSKKYKHYQITDIGLAKLERIRQQKQNEEKRITEKALAGIQSNIDKFPAPTQEMLNSLEFNLLWECMKSWDIRVPEIYEGYCKTTGNHVRAILEKLKKGE